MTAMDNTTVPSIEQEDTTIHLLSEILPPLPDDGTSQRLYLVRHGETDWNAQGKIQGGGFDIPLNDQGRAQAHRLAKALQGLPISLLGSSHLARARATADIVAAAAACHHPTAHRVVDAGLAEMSFGDFEGLAFHHNHNHDNNPQIARFREIGRLVKQDPDVAWPHGESTRQVQERSVRAVQRIMQRQQQCRHVLLVAHGRTNKILLSALLRQTTTNDNDDDNSDALLPRNIPQGNTCINVLDVDAHGKWKLQLLNHVQHVQDHHISRNDR